MANKKYKILLVEDDKRIQEELANFLTRYTNNSLYIAEDGLEGLEIFEKHKPDIVISDIKMPNMDGLSMTEKIKEKMPDQPIILCSAHSDGLYFMKSIDLHVSGYLVKPIDLKRLAQKINEIGKSINLKKELKLHDTILNEIVQLQGNMLAVLDQDKIPIYANKNLLDYFGFKDIEEAQKNRKEVVKRFVSSGDSFMPDNSNPRGWIEQIEEYEPEKRVVTISDSSGKREHTFIICIEHFEDSKHTIVLFTEVTDLANDRLEFKKLAMMDELTKIPNRTMLNIRLKKEISKAQETGKHLSIVLIDIDYFKKINDKYGHLVGDKILVEFTKRVQRKIRANDMLARWGGEEFVLILPGSDMIGAFKISEVIQHSINTHLFNENIPMTCSFGVASFDKNNNTFEKLLKKADEALYKAKKLGRNKIVAE